MSIFTMAESFGKTKKGGGIETIRKEENEVA